jgi:hypothetical protein
VAVIVTFCCTQETLVVTKDYVALLLGLGPPDESTPR